MSVWPVAVLLPLCLLACLTRNKALGDSSRNFMIDNNGVKGTGNYKIINGVVKIGLELTIGAASDELNDSGTAVITSLPSKNEPSTPPNPNSGPSTSPPPNSTPISKLPPNSGPGVIPLPNSTPLPPVEPEVSLTPEDNQFIDEMVAVHNELRSVHFSPPLQNNTQMSLSAKRYALLLASQTDLVHSPVSTRPDEGENLAMGCSTADGQAITAEETVKKWYEEACHHNFSLHTFQDISGHFSQLVWKASEEIGVGRAFGKKWGMNCTFIVARYKPEGNIEAAFKENVEKGTFDPVVYNCSGLSPGVIAGDKNQYTDGTSGKKQQPNRLLKNTLHDSGNILENKVPYSNSNMQRYKQMHYGSSKGLNGNVLGFRGTNSGVNFRGYTSKPFVSRYHGYQINNKPRPLVPRYRDNQVNNKGYYSSRFFSNGLDEYEASPRSLISKAKTYHTPLIMKRDKKIVWLLS